jgi:transcriptional regulator GlxA family with amidase domain
MKHISILVPSGDAVVGSIEGPFKVFSQVNEILKSQRKSAAFRIELVGTSSEITLNQGRITLHPSRTILEKFRTDLIVIPAPNGDVSRILSLNQPLIEWIRLQRKNGTEVASLCMGAFILAATGLLKGQECATHWIAASRFRELFPDVILNTEKIVVEDGGIYSSAGAFSYLNLILHLIEKYTSREIAVLTAKIFEIDIDRQSQSPFMIFQGQKEHSDAVVRKVQYFIEENFRERLTVESLASLACLSRRNLERRFKKATSLTTLEYIQRVKVEAAKLDLENSRHDVTDVMISVGYSDPKAFRDLFRRFTGLSPLEYRSKFSLTFVM